MERKKNKTNEEAAYKSKKDSSKIIAIEKEILYSEKSDPKLSSKSHEKLYDVGQAKLSKKDNEKGKPSGDLHEIITGEKPYIDENVQTDNTGVCRGEHDLDAHRTHENLAEEPSDIVLKDIYRTPADNEPSTPRRDESDEHERKRKPSNLDYNLSNSEFQDLKVLANKMNRKSSEKRPAIIQAVRQENPILLKIMADLKPKKLNERDQNGDTALHVAIREGYFEMAHALLDVHPAPSVDIMNKKERTPLHEAALVNQADLAERLLELGAYRDVADKYLVTPLIMAVHTGSLGVVRVLLEHKAETILMDSSFQSALDYGNASDYEPIVEMLLRREDERRKEIDERETMADTEQEHKETVSKVSELSAIEPSDSNKIELTDPTKGKKAPSKSKFSLSTSKSKILQFFSSKSRKKSASGTSMESSPSRVNQSQPSQSVGSMQPTISGISIQPTISGISIQSSPSAVTTSSQSMVSLNKDPKESNSYCADLESDLNESWKKLEEVERQAKMKKEKTTSVLSRSRDAPSQIEVQDYGYKQLWRDVSKESSLFQPQESSSKAHSTPKSDHQMVRDAADDKEASETESSSKTDWKQAFKRVKSDVSRLGRSKSDNYIVNPDNSPSYSESVISKERVHSKKASKAEPSTISMDQSTGSHESMRDVMEADDGNSKLELTKRKTKSLDSL